MPNINVKTNARLTREKKLNIMNRLSDAISLIPGKSDAYFMCGVDDGADMMFHRDSDSCMAFVTVSIFGSSDKQSYERLTREICSILEDEAGVSGGFCYVKFEEVRYWGYNGRMF